MKQPSAAEQGLQWHPTPPGRPRRCTEHVVATPPAHGRHHEAAPVHVITGDRPHRRRPLGSPCRRPAASPPPARPLLRPAGGWLCISSSKASVSKAELGTLRRRATSSRTTFVKRTSRSRRGVVTRRSPRGFTPCSTPSSSSSTAPMPNSLCSYHIFCVVICDMRGYNP